MALYRSFGKIQNKRDVLDALFLQIKQCNHFPLDLGQSIEAVCEFHIL